MPKKRKSSVPPSPDPEPTSTRSKGKSRASYAEPTAASSSKSKESPPSVATERKSKSSPEEGSSSKPKSKKSTKEPREGTRKSSRIRASQEPESGPEVTQSVEDPPPEMSNDSGSEPPNIAMARLYKKYYEEPFGPSGQSVMTQVGFYEGYNLVRADMTQQDYSRAVRSPRYHLKEEFLQLVNDLVFSLQSFIEEAAILTEREQPWRIDPTGLYLGTLYEGSNNYKALVAAWRILADRLGRGRRFFEKYVREIRPDQEGMEPFQSPATTNRDLYEQVDNELDTEAKLFASYAKIRSLNQTLSASGREALMVQGSKHWEKIIPIDQSLSEFEAYSTDSRRSNWKPSRPATEPGIGPSISNPFGYSGRLPTLLESDEEESSETETAKPPETPSKTGPAKQWSFGTATPSPTGPSSASFNFSMGGSARFKPSRNFFGGPLGQGARTGGEETDEPNAPKEKRRESSNEHSRGRSTERDSRSSAIILGDQQQRTYQTAEHHPDNLFLERFPILQGNHRRTQDLRRMNQQPRTHQTVERHLGNLFLGRYPILQGNHRRTQDLRRTDQLLSHLEGRPLRVNKIPILRELNDLPLRRGRSLLPRRIILRTSLQCRLQDPVPRLCLEDTVKTTIHHHTIPLARRRIAPEAETNRTPPAIIDLPIEEEEDQVADLQTIQALHLMGILEGVLAGIEAIVDQEVSKASEECKD
ncbi:hypothetical protein BDZ89DRAFT_1135258 [Hymenopellis radicata]|nr:hypothetical protein BDZ89DRAFT_1135258 [Hymenopellis radicata]